MPNPFATAISSLLPEPQASLLNGMVFGIRSSLPKPLYQDLITTGTVHMIALSGMNISILTALIEKMTQPLGRKLSVAGTILFMTGFVLFVGPSPSIVRAAIMAAMALTATVSGRQYWPLFALVVSALGMLAFQPQLIVDVSFQLSFLATLGIIVAQRSGLNGDKGNKGAMGKIMDMRNGIVSSLKENLRLTLYAQLFTAPILIFRFGRLSLIAPVANLAVEWAVQPIMILGLITGLFGAIWYPLGLVPAWLAWVPLTYVLTVVQWLATVPGAQISFF